MCSARSASIASLWVTPESKRNAQFTHTRRTSNVSLFSDVSHLRLFHPSQTGLRVHLLLSHCLSMCRTYLVLPSRTAVKKHRGEASSTSVSTKGTCRRPRLGFMLILSLVFFFYPSYILLLPQKTILYILKLAKWTFYVFAVPYTSVVLHYFWTWKQFKYWKPIEMLSKKKFRNNETDYCFPFSVNIS